MWNDPGRVLGDLPQPRQRARVRTQAAHVVQVLECAQDRGGLKAEAGGGKRLRPAQRGQLGQAEQAGTQPRTHPLAGAQHRILDARAVGGQSGEPRLFHQCRAHRKADRAVDRSLGPPPHHVDDQMAHALAGRRIPRPFVGDLVRAFTPYDVSRRGEAGGGIGSAHALLCFVPIDASGGLPDARPALAVFRQPRPLHVGEACDLNQRQASRPWAPARAGGARDMCLRPA